MICKIKDERSLLLAADVAAHTKLITNLTTLISTVDSKLSSWPHESHYNTIFPFLHSHNDSIVCHVNLRNPGSRNKGKFERFFQTYRNILRKALHTGLQVQLGDTNLTKVQHS